MSAKTALIADERYTEHDTGMFHPESPKRYNAIMDAVKTAIDEGLIDVLEPRMATEDDILLCHSKTYLETAKHDIERGQPFLSTGDTNVCKKSYEIALLAAGGILTATDAVLEGRYRNAFCNVRPPGHHATREAGMGFCVFNNIAIAARYAQKKHGLERALIVDWDIHHGNGTQDIFYDDPSVFYFSTHAWPFYPGTGQAHEKGAGKGKGFTMNCPFPAGTCGKDMVDAFNKKLAPEMRSFRPDIVMITAGFDSRIGDMIGNFALIDEDYVELTRICMGMADEYCEGRIISSLAGGYTLSGLASSAAAHIRTLAGAS